MSIGIRIRGLRKERRMSLRALGQAAGLTAGFLCDLEHGKRSVSVDNAASIAEALGIPVAWLVGDTRPVDSIRSLADAADSIASLLRSDAGTLADFHAYAQRFGGQPGSNVHDFVLRDALAYRGITIERLRNPEAI